jgi:hypothetical protein
LEISLTQKIHNFYFHPLVKKKIWDGSVCFVDKKGPNWRIPIGLWREVMQICEKYGFEVEIEGLDSIILSDLTLEDTRYGSALNKYISKNVVLNQEAEDLIVYVTGYRPAGTDITVYGKFLNNNDQEQFDQKSWSILQNQQAGIYGSPQDTEDYREYVYYVPTGNTVANSVNAYLDPAAIDPLNVITYYDNVGRNYTGFSTFGIKIVLTSNNPVKIPTMRDVRAIALQK